MFDPSMIADIWSSRLTVPSAMVMSLIISAHSMNRVAWNRFDSWSGDTGFETDFGMMSGFTGVDLVGRVNIQLI